LSVTVSASYRTDIPAFCAGWFLRRLRAGHCRRAILALTTPARTAASIATPSPTGNRAVANFRKHDPDAAMLFG
jgi:hypothetical protein